MKKIKPLLSVKKGRIAFIKFLMLLIFSCLTACSSETDLIENSKPAAENIITLHKNYDFVKSNPLLFNKLTKADTQKTTAKSSNIETADFTIFTERVTYKKRIDISTESYTFYIERKGHASNKSMDNLILTRNLRDENFKAYLISYSFPDGIASEHKNFSVSNFKELNSETFAFTNLTAKTACVYIYEITETPHKCYTGRHSGISEARNCDGEGSEKPYSTFAIAVLFDNCGGGGGGISPGNEHNPGDVGSGPGNEYTPGGGGTPGSGGGNPVDTGMSFPPPCQTSDCDVKLLANDINDMLGNTLNYEQLSFLFENNDVAVTIENYLDQNNNTAGKTFTVWAINYLIQNPTVTIDQFKNWFMGNSEGQDGDYDAEYWDDPNLTFPQQDLPSFENFKNACPSKYTNAESLCNTIGGEILNMYNAVIAKGNKLNTCAIRISRALNYSGITIPSLPDNSNGTKNSVLGADGKNYIINAKALNSWMKKTFGTNSANYEHYTGSQGGDKGINFPNLFKNKKGIYTMVAKPDIQKTWGSGHADLLENGECLLNCHFYEATSQLVPVDYIDIWILD